MKFYHYHQNNSGGSYAGQYHEIIVEAPNPDSADREATRFGVYFDGCSTGQDCNCCGDRWYPANDWNGEDQPMLYSVVLDEALTEEQLVAAHPKELGDFAWHPVDILVVHHDGRTREWHFTMELLEKAKELHRNTKPKLYGFRVWKTGVSDVREFAPADYDPNVWYDEEGNLSINGKGWKHDPNPYGAMATFGTEDQSEAESAQKVVAKVIEDVLAAQQEAATRTITASYASQKLKTSLKRLYGS